MCKLVRGLLTKKCKLFLGRYKSLHMSASAKNLSRLKDLSIENLWLIGANDKELRKILPLVNLKYLNLYQVLAKDLTILETQGKSCKLPRSWANLKEKIINFKIAQDENNKIHRESNYCYVETT